MVTIGAIVKTLTSGFTEDIFGTMPVRYGDIGVVVETYTKKCIVMVNGHWRVPCKYDEVQVIVQGSDELAELYNEQTALEKRIKERINALVNEYGLSHQKTCKVK